MNNTIQRLWQWGHFNNPEYDCGSLTDQDISEIDINDDCVKLAISSYQNFFYNDISHFCKHEYNRNLIIDGEIGPATEKLLNNPRCSCPDYPVITENATWPGSCRNKISTSYYFNGLNLNDKTIRKSWELALGSWEKLLELKFNLLKNFSRNNRIWATDSSLGGNILAWSELARNNCNVTLEQRYNTRTNWNLEFLQSTICHEVGHALGSYHLKTRNSIMYPSITSLVIPQKADVDNMVKLGYKRKTEQPKPNLPNYGTATYL